MQGTKCSVRAVLKPSTLLASAKALACVFPPVHDWLIRYSLPISQVDMATAEATLDRFATRLDCAGSTAATVTRRRRSVFGAYLKHAVRSGQLAADPLSASWKPPLVDREVSPDLVPTLKEARALLDAAEHGGKRGKRLTALFATLTSLGSDRPKRSP